MRSTVGRGTSFQNYTSVPRAEGASQFPGSNLQCALDCGCILDFLTDCRN